MTDVIRQTGCTFSRRLRRQATRKWSEALLTMYPTRRSCEANGISKSNTWYGTSLECMVNGNELSINLVKTNKLKLLIGLSLYNDKNNTIDEICKTLNISRATLYRYIKVK
jgi:predicted transcriptional regulator YheO